jgi:diguanylate cyclase (GGDEF)-like protein
MMSRLTTLVLGPTGRARAAIVMTLLTWLIYCLFALLLQILEKMDLVEPQAACWLIAYCLLGPAVFYLLLRSGLSARLSKEPSLLLWQNVQAVSAIVWAYAIVSSARGAILAILVLVIAYGMLALRGRQSHMLTLFSVIVLAATMWWKTLTEPLRYPMQEEVINLAIAVIVLLGVTALSLRMTAIRTHLRRQKLDLEDSLERIRLLATQDELTGLANRRQMTALLKVEMARAQRSGQALSIALLDLDYFKRINDKFGHQAGDIVLMGFADAAGRGLRSSDVLARWGGEEFLLMLPNTGTDEAGQCVVRMRKDLSRIVFEEVAPGLRVTFSAGLTTFQAGESLEALTERADRAMYRAKAEGRNCTVRA